MVCTAAEYHHDKYIINTPLHRDCCCMLQFNCIMDGVSENWTSIVINVEENDDRLNHFGDGFGGNDHTLLIRGDMLFIYTVDAPYRNRLYPLRVEVAYWYLKYSTFFLSERLRWHTTYARFVEIYLERYWSPFCTRFYVRKPMWIFMPWQL